MENITIGQIALGLAFIVGLWKSVEFIGEKVSQPFKAMDKKMDTIIESDAHQREALKCLLRNRLLALYKECADKGFATSEEQTDFHEMFVQYEALKGNSFVKSLKDKMELFPLERAKK